MPQKNQNQKGFANMIVLIIFLLTMGGAVVYFKNFPLEKLPAGGVADGETSPKPHSEKSSDVVLVENKNSTYVNTLYGFSFVPPVEWRVSNEFSAFFDALETVEQNSKFTLANLDDTKNNIEFTRQINQAIEKWQMETSSSLHLTNMSEKEVLSYAESWRADISNTNKLSRDFDDHTFSVRMSSGDGRFKEATSTPTKIRKYITLKNGIRGSYMENNDLSREKSVTMLTLPLKKQNVVQNGKPVKSVVIMVANHALTEKQVLDFGDTFQFSQ